MCSINEQHLDFANIDQPKRHFLDLKGSTCKKCSQEKATVLLRTRDSYCRACFLKYATHKFRATLGKSKLVKPKDRILVASSGSQSSVALLHLLAEGLSEQNNKRFLFTSVVVYIDEGAIIEQTREERLEALAAVARQAEDLNFPFYVVQLSHSLNLKSIRILKMTSKGEGIDLHENGTIAGDEQLMSLFKGIRTITSKEDLLRLLRQNLLVAVAKQLNCNKVLMADVGSQLAVRVISNVSLGRGAHLPWDTGFCDVRDPAVMILRPLKEFMSKEIAFYCILNQLNPMAIPSLSTMASQTASIRRLAENFLHGLETDFPSTFSAIIKTGDKLAPPMEGQDRCILCKATLGQRFRECSSQQATLFSKELVSLMNAEGDTVCKMERMRMDGNDCSVGRGAVEGGECGTSRGEQEVRRKGIHDALCYGCRLIAEDMDNPEEFLDMVIPVGTCNGVNS